MDKKKDKKELAAIHISALAGGKAQYKDADAALEMVIAECAERCKECGQLKAGQVINMPLDKPESITRDDWNLLRGKKFRLVDKFEKKHSIGVGLSARRFELEEVEEVGR